MANKYIGAMVDIILEVNPNFDRTTAEHLARNGLQETWAYELKKMASGKDPAGNNIWDKKIKESNNPERNSTGNYKGTLCK